MTTNDRESLNQRLENLFFNYYQKIGLLEAEEPPTKNYREKFLRERFVERILFTTMEEAGLADLAGKKVLITGLSQDLVSFFQRFGAAPADITLTDVCPQALERVKADYSGQLNVVKVDLDAFPLPDKTFDLTVCFNYLSNIPNNEYISGLSGEFYRTLKPGGLFLINFTNEIASRDSVQSAGVLRLFQPQEVQILFQEFKSINLLDFIPFTFDRFRINDEPSYPKKIGFIEDLLIEQRNRYSEAMLILSKEREKN